MIIDAYGGIAKILYELAGSYQIQIKCQIPPILRLSSDRPKRGECGSDLVH